jgi:hypothetical protein
MFVRMDRVGCPPGVDRLRHLFLAVSAPADKFKAVDDDSRRHDLPEMKFELGEITQN